MKHHLLVLIAGLALVACGHGQKGGDGKGSGSAAGSAAAGSGSAVSVAEPITRAECEQMMGHILDVGVAEMPEADRPTPEQIEQIRKKMLGTEEEMQKCLAFDRVVFTCVMAATDTAALNPCIGEE